MILMTGPSVGGGLFSPAPLCASRRRLVLMVRESPFHTGHLRTMTSLSEMGAIIAPPLPAFYSQPETIDDLVNHSVGRVLDLFDIDAAIIKRWGVDIG